MGDAPARCVTVPGFARAMCFIAALAIGGLAPFAAAPTAAAPTTPGSGNVPILAAESAASVTFRVYATREGGVGLKTSSGHVITENDHFVALPSFAALNKKVRVAYKGKSETVPVLDVGPWNNKDDYWMPSEARVFKGLPRGVPQAYAANKEKHNDGKSGLGETVTVPCGIDIGDGTWYALGLNGPEWVDVTFLFLTDDPSGGATGPVSAVSPASTTPATKPTTSAPTPAASLLPAASGIDASKTPVLGASDAPPLDDAVAIGAGYTFVPQTKHNVPDIVAKYWKEKGGVPMFGFPLSETFIRKASGETHVYQYFERIILEYLPESNSVALAPLGAWFAEVNGPYAKVAAFESTAKKRYVAKTGHGIAGGILQWYAANGDEAMFGAPLDEEGPYTTPDGRKVTAQLFERARIEFDESGNVTLARLGAEWLGQRGWT